MLYQNENVVKKQMLSELDAVIALQEGNLCGKEEVEVNLDRSTISSPDAEHATVLQRIFTLHIVS